jgi:hypothetical protein
VLAIGCEADAGDVAHGFADTLPASFRDAP